MTDPKENFIDEVMQLSKSIAEAVSDTYIIGKADKSKVDSSITEVKNRIDELEVFLESRIVKSKKVESITYDIDGLGRFLNKNEPLYLLYPEGESE